MSTTPVDLSGGLEPIPQQPSQGGGIDLSGGLEPITPAPKPGYLQEGIEGIGRGLKNMVTGPFDLAKQRPAEQTGVRGLHGESVFPSTEMTPEQESALGPVGRFLYHSGTDIASGLARSFQAYKEAKGQGENEAGANLRSMEEFPVLGGIVRKAEEAGPGYAKFEPATLGAVTEGATYAGVPRLLAGSGKTPAPNALSEIPMTVGERAGPGMAYTADSILAKVGAASKRTGEFLHDRSAKMSQRATDVGEGVTKAPVGTVGDTVQAGARSTFDAQRAANRQAGAMIADRTVGQAAAPTREAAVGDIAQSVRGREAAAHTRESAAHTAVADEATRLGVTVDTTPLQNTAQEIAAIPKAAQDFLASSLPPKVMGLLEKSGSGVEPDPRLTELAQLSGWTVDDPRTIAAAQKANIPVNTIGQQVPFAVMKDARSAIGQAVEAARRGREAGTPGADAAYAALSKLYGQATEIMGTGASQDAGLLSAWQDANALTRERHGTFIEPDDIRKIVRGDDPQAVVSRVMTNGSAQNLLELRNALQDSPDAMARAQRAVVNDIFDKSIEGSKSPAAVPSIVNPDHINFDTALKVLRNRMGLKDFLGDQQFRQLEQQFEAARAAQFDPQAAAFDTFLRRTIKAEYPAYKVEDPGDVVAKAAQSSGEARNIAQMARMSGNPGMTLELGKRIWLDLADKASENGAFGANDSVFDVHKFGDAYKKARPSLQELLPQQNISAMDDLVKNLQRYGLNASGKAGGFSRFFFASRMLLAPLRLLTQPTPAGAATAAGIIWGPKLWMELSTRPALVRQLSGAIKAGRIAATSAAVTGAATANQQFKPQPSAPPAQPPAQAPPAQAAPPAGVPHNVILNGKVVGVTTDGGKTMIPTGQ